MAYEVEETGDLTRRAHVSVPGDDFRAEVNDALRDLADEVDISGFRQGNVPFSMIRSRYGDRVKPEIIEDLVRDSIEELADEYGERLLRFGDTEVEQIPEEEDDDLEFAIDFEVQPDIDPIGYKGVTVEKPEPEVSDEEVDQRLDELREEHADLEPLQFRNTIEEGDVVTFDFEPLEKRDGLENVQGRDVEIEVGAGQMIPQIEEALVGAEADGLVEVEFEADETFPVQEVRGDEIGFRVNIKSAQNKVLPELNDEFAQETGDASTLLQLRSNVREELRDEKEHRARHIAEQNLIATLLDQNDVSVPESFLDEQVENELERRREMFEQQGLDPGELGGDAFEEETRERVEQDVKEEFLLMSIADKEGLEADEEDVDAWFEHRAQHDPRFADERLQRQIRQDEEQMEQIRYQAKLDKTKEMLLDEAEFEEIPWPDEQAPPAAGAGDDSAEASDDPESTDDGESAASSDDDNEDS